MTLTTDVMTTAVAPMVLSVVLLLVGTGILKANIFLSMGGLALSLLIPFIDPILPLALRSMTTWCLLMVMVSIYLMVAKRPFVMKVSSNNVLMNRATGLASLITSFILLSGGEDAAWWQMLISGVCYAVLLGGVSHGVKQWRMKHDFMVDDVRVEQERNASVSLTEAGFVILLLIALVVVAIAGIG